MAGNIAVAVVKLKNRSSVKIVADKNNVAGLTNYDPITVIIGISVLIRPRHLKIPSTIIVILPLVIPLAGNISLRRIRNWPCLRRTRSYS